MLQTFFSNSIKKIKQPASISDLFIAGLLFAIILTIPSYLAFFYKVTFSMGGWRVPLIKFSWFYALFIVSNLFWLMGLFFWHLRRKNRLHPSSMVWLFILSNTLGAVLICTDFVHFNLFMEHWSIDTVTAAFIGVAGGQAPMGIHPINIILAIVLFVGFQYLLINIAKCIPRPKVFSILNPAAMSVVALSFLFLLIGIQRAIPPNWHNLHLQEYIPWVTFVKKPVAYPIDDEQINALSEMEAQKAQALEAITKKSQYLTSLQPTSRPNILFVHVEGLRSDMLNAKTMPRLTAFASNKGEVLGSHYSSSNNTGQGMFSLLTGLYGTYYQNFRESPTPVAPIEILKKLGYQLTVHNSMSDAYEQLGELFFDGFRKHEVHDGTIAENDALLFDETTQQLAGFNLGDQPRFDYVFLNSTHFPYEYPDAFRKFTPIMESMSYDTSIRNDMEVNKHAVRNTFLNAVNFADHLISGLLHTLADTDYWSNSIVIVVGDHGQEFWEHNRFGHVYGMTKEQTKVMAYVSFPDGLKTDYHFTSHQDFFPSIFSLMGLSDQLPTLMNGKNLYEFDQHKDYALIRMSVLSSQKRFEEGIISKDIKVVYQLKEQLEITAITNEDDEPIDDYLSIKPAVYSLIKKIDQHKKNSLNRIINDATIRPMQPKIEKDKPLNNHFS